MSAQPQQKGPLAPRLLYIAFAFPENNESRIQLPKARDSVATKPQEVQGWPFS